MGGERETTNVASHGDHVDNDSAAPVNASLGLRHEAGLSAGETMALRVGSTEFGPAATDDAGELASGTPAAVGFTLHVADDDAVRIAPGSAPVSVDGEAVTNVLRVEPGQIIRCGSDAFSVVRLRNGAPPPYRSGGRPADRVTPIRVTPTEPGRTIPLLWLCLTVVAVGVVLALAVDPWWWLLVAGGVLLAGVSWWRQRARRAADQARHDEAVAAARATLRDDLDRAGAERTNFERSRYPGPAALLSSADRARPQGTLAERSLLSIGLADRPWKPTIEDRPNAGWSVLPGTKDVRQLPDLPLVVDALGGPLAIAGPRAAVLAAARGITLAVARQLRPQECAITTPGGPEWAWAAPLLHASRPSVLAAERSFTIVDGDDDPLPPHGLLLLDKAEAIPSGCQGLLIIGDDGMASLTNPGDGWLRSTGVIPHGVSESSANRAAATVVDLHRRDDSANVDDDDGGITDNADDTIDLRDRDRADEPELRAVAPLAATGDAVDAGPTSERTSTAASADGATPTRQPSLCLFTASHLTEANELLAKMATDMATHRGPEQLDLFVIDDLRGSLIRLKQVPQCQGHTLPTIGGIDGIVRDATTSTVTGRSVTVVVADIENCVTHLDRCGRHDLVDALLHLAPEGERQRVVVAGSAPNEPPTSDRLAIGVHARIDRINGEATVIDEEGERTIRLEDAAVRNLTAAVAAVRTQILGR